MPKAKGRGCTPGDVHDPVAIILLLAQHPIAAIQFDTRGETNHISPLAPQLLQLHLANIFIFGAGGIMHLRAVQLGLALAQYSDRLNSSHGWGWGLDPYQA